LQDTYKKSLPAVFRNDRKQTSSHWSHWQQKKLYTLSSSIEKHLHDFEIYGFTK